MRDIDLIKSCNIMLLCLMVNALSSCRTGNGTAADTKDIATNSASGGISLYFRENQSISRTQCPDGLLVNDTRANCTINKQSVSAKPFIDAISVGVGDTIDQHAKNVQDLYAGISTVDKQLLQLLLAAPATQAQVQTLERQLTTAETNIAATQVQLSGLDQQIAAMKTRLASQNNVDLNIQLGQLLDERASVLTKENPAKADEQTKREQFIAANSSTLDPETFSDVQTLKATYQQQLDTESAALASAMQQVSDLNKTIAHIGDPAFTFPVVDSQQAFNALKPFTQRFQAAFDTLATAAAATAPAFSPTTFGFGGTPTITFSPALPSWVVNISVTVDGGQPSVLPAAAQMSLPVNTSSAGTHSIQIALVDAGGQMSQPGPVQSVTVNPATVDGTTVAPRWWIDNGNIGALSPPYDEPIWDDATDTGYRSFQEQGFCRKLNDTAYLNNQCPTDLVAYMTIQQHFTNAVLHWTFATGGGIYPIPENHDAAGFCVTYLAKFCSLLPRPAP